LILSLTYSHFPTDVSFPLIQLHSTDYCVLHNAYSHSSATTTTAF